jgi:hypothetical protein
MVDEIIDLILMARAYHVLDPVKHYFPREDAGVPVCPGFAINRFTSIRLWNEELIYYPGNDRMALSRAKSFDFSDPQKSTLPPAIPKYIWSRTIRRKGK